MHVERFFLFRSRLFFYSITKNRKRHFFSLQMHDFEKNIS